MTINRRGLLIGAGVLGLGAAGLGANSVRGRRLLGRTGPDGEVPSVSPAAVVRKPWGAVIGSGPPVLALHGRGGDVDWWVGLGLPQFLTSAGGGFSILAVDGDEDYWVDLELPEPVVAALGVSMGGFGVLDLARRVPLRAVAAISPALFPTWEDADVIKGFASREIWEAHEPLRHTGEVTAPVGVWCGREDPFHDPAQDLAARVEAQVRSFDHGAHDNGYWRRVMPEALRFIKDRL
ncbi:hypothetical protein FKR81_13390 [Lentzea tibetensis]|uniref:Esterase n=1 Tax=Lentzea tibetensis TaxID=2591470 RepID=A0A563EVW2_9PSEU|nr:hypothetical protein [Lentzea tibetensis]TWP51840.1 hypothetical protein FKR81_13390 [Lentzea tibetensis]